MTPHSKIPNSKTGHSMTAHSMIAHPIPGPPQAGLLRTLAGRRRRASRLAPLALLCLGACLTPSEPPPVRYFSVMPSALEAVAARELPESSRAVGRVVRLRQFRSAGHLQERWVWRRGSEFGFADQLRWTDPPVAYLERALAHTLFEERGLRGSESNQAPVLDLELTAFDWIPGPQPEVHLALTLRLEDRGRQATYLETSLTLSVPVGGAGESLDIARAMGRGLGQIVDEAADWVIARLLPPASESQ